MGIFNFLISVLDFVAYYRMDLVYFFFTIGIVCFCFSSMIFSDEKRNFVR